MNIVAMSVCKECANLVVRTDKDGAPIVGIVAKNENAIPTGENECLAIDETLYLLSIPGMVESLKQGGSDSLGDCVPEDALEW